MINKIYIIHLFIIDVNFLAMETILIKFFRRYILNINFTL
jgi:hypothetical protein